ncbi:hypothetical protein [Mucilaginibacter celer]|uniref:Uncharacterized protein n=1 Tax=Mucilaginibacter celer TaxID=2305508 RepID=A0A494VMS5_9SPHI|nr:hypothetical protein [Mucilaginibacter celer]AYL94270.1 hypothetical protein HYN43_002710 [Mucilaginibacter celer]
MKRILTHSISDFSRELDATIAIVSAKSVPAELGLFQSWLSLYYTEIRAELQRLAFLTDLEEESIYVDIFNEFSSLQQTFRVLDSRYLPGLYRTHRNDALTLKLLHWLHSAHAQTAQKPFFVLDGDFAIFPTVDFPVSYYLPVAAQQSLLYLPLFFHELGHYLYQHHRAEMDDLVREFQKKLNGYLMPVVRKNDDDYEADAKQARQMVETWYDWLQELFCDAVGIEIGGATYARAFSFYLRMQGRSAFYRPEKDLFNSSHPVTRLRILFIVRRCRELGLNQEADELEKEWKTIAAVLDAPEDYYGFYENKWENDVANALDDMMTEADPIKFTDYKADPSSWIGLIHQAWQQFELDPVNYKDWESQAVSNIINATT